MESFWRTMKNELVYHKHYKTREQELREITEYIEEALIPITCCIQETVCCEERCSMKNIWSSRLTSGVSIVF